MHYYNENDPFAAAWLRELIKRELIPEGFVDERSIVEVKASELREYGQCHFFAGIGGWSHALGLAGWPEDEPVWTGSCPCQPFSVAGRGEGEKDARHLWPAFRTLIEECGPAVVFGEQVAGKAGLEWLSGVRADLEAVGYALGAADLCAAGISAPHPRQRLYWGASRLAESNSRERRWITDRKECIGDRETARRIEGDYVLESSGTIGSAGAWSKYEIIACGPGKARRVEPGTFPLANGVPARVGRLRGYGNAIVPQVAAKFIQAYVECRTLQGAFE